MIKLKITTLVLAISCFAFQSNAQFVAPASNNNANSTGIASKYSSTDWLSMMRDRSVNVHDVQNAFYKWYSLNHKEDKDKTHSKSGEDEDGAYEFFKRWEWFNLPRADAQGNRVDLYKVGTEYQNYLNARATDQAIHNGNNIGGGLHSSPPSSGTWTYKGNNSVPTNGGDGRVNRVRLMPGNNATMFACSPSGGLWKSTNSGTSWSTTTDQLGDLTTSDIAINPLKTNVMYLATGDADGIQSIYPTPGTIGVLKSYDGGNTWVATSLAYSLSTSGANSYSISELIIDPADTSVIIAATTFGIWRSANSGATWTNVQAGWFHSIEFEPSHPSNVYAAASNLYHGGAAFYRSVNNGVTWTQITNGLPASGNAEGYEIGVTAADSNYVYILADSVNIYGYEGVYRSTNDGLTFSTMSSLADGAPNIMGWSCDGFGDVNGQGWYTLSLAVSQTNADSIWTGGVNMWQSPDGGSTWTLTSDWTGGSCTPAKPYVHADIHAIQFIPGVKGGFVVGCDGGVFSTANNGKTWTDISNNLAIAQQYCVGASTLTANKWLTGWQDNGSNLSTPSWNETLGGDGMDCFISWTSDNDMYAENPQGGLQCSSNGGGSWNSCTTGITEQGPWVTPWLEDPKTSNTFYSGFVNIWKSTGSMTPSWTKVSTWGSSGITAIAVDSANPNYVYAAQANTIEISTNAGGSWTNITNGLPSPITGIALDSKKPGRVWVTVGGYSSGNHVYYSKNSGGTWTNITADGGGLPNLPVNCIVSESGSPSGIYVGTDQGVYYHDTVINNWVFYNTGLPMVMIGDLTIYKPGKQLIAATYGRGTWETPIYTTSPPTAYFYGTPTTICAGSSVSFTDTSYNFPTTWAWTFPGGTPASASTPTVSVVYATSGLYNVSLTVTNSNGPSSLTKTNYINVLANPTVSASATTNVLCTGGNTGVATAVPGGGASPYTYSWAPSGGTNISATGLTAGTYTVNLTDAHGCSASATAIVTQPATALNVSANVTTNISCFGGSNGAVTATASNGTLPYTYTWSGGGTNAVKSGLSAGTYSITVKDKNGCTASTTVSIGQPSAINLTSTFVNMNSTGACNGQATVNVTGGTGPYTYSWSPGSGSTDTINGKCPNTYCCLVTDANGCTSSTCVTIVNVTGVANIDNNSSSINIYPDPNNGSFTIAGVIPGQVIEVYNNLGQRLSSSVADNNAVSFDIANKADGIYMVRILNKDGSLVTQKKILKEE